uniref:Retrovirus-related Pol polyprotein from transposon TNT 1-94 n=1 Tax=Tanacetum cinerariifolium TaxID=118510 RepID=A0A6L2MXD3_TANCI|nr:retrovirus-related Pol polyprotein from transposon TNT 1-94 [Tanacetum cinerariifolium]
MSCYKGLFDILDTLVLGELGPDGVALVWVLDMLPLPCSASKLEIVVLALPNLSCISLVMASSTALNGTLNREDITKEELVTQKEEMELESTQFSTTAKLSLLKQVVEIITYDASTSTKKKNDVKARSMLLMALPNEHLMTFNQYKDANTLFAAIETRFGGNESTKKTQKTLLKQLYKNFSATGTESIDSIFNRLQKLMNKSDLDTISLDDLYNNFKIVKQERNKSDLDTISLDDLYNNFKIVEQEMGHFVRECRVPRNQENRTRNQETTRRIVNMEDTSSKAMVAIDGAGFDWSYMADDEAPTNMAFMAILDSEVYTNNTCSKTCLKNYAILKSQYDKLRVEFNKSKCNLADYKRGLASVEEQLVHYQMNECLLNENIVVLKRDIKIKDSKIVILKSKLEKISNEKDALETKIDKFENASQSLDKLIGSQVTDNSKKGLGYVNYNALPPPHTGSVKIFAPVKENNGAPLIEDWESGEEDEVESPPEKERKTVEPSMDKVEVEIPKQNDKPTRRPVKYAEMYRTQRPKACYVCGSFSQLQTRCKYHKRERMVNGTNHSRVNHNANRVPKAMLTRTGLKPVNSVRPVNPKRNFQRRAVYNNKNFFKKVNTAKKKVNIARQNSAVLNAVRANKGKAWMFPAYDMKYILSPDFKEFNGGYVAFGGGAKGAYESHVLLKVPRKNNMYSVDMKNIIPKKDLTCLNRILVVKPYFKTPYELFRGRILALSFMRPFGCLVTILNTLNHLGKFGCKSDEGFFVGYSINSKAFRVYNTRTRKVEENLHIKFLENKPLIADSDGDNQDNDDPSTKSEIDNQGWPNDENSTKDINTIGPSINTASLNINTASPTVNIVRLSDDFFGADNDIRSLDRIELDISNISTIYPVPTTPDIRINKDHSLDNVIGDIQSVGKRAIGTKWVFRNKKDERGIVIRNKARLVTQRCTQEEGIDYDEVFSPVVKIEAIRLFLAYASFMRFLVYQMDVKSAFLYKRIEEEVYVCQPPEFEDPDYPDKVYKVEKALYGLHQAPRACSMGELTFFLGLQVKQKSDGILISQDKYVDEILRKFKHEDVKPASTPMDIEKALLKELDGDDVDVHLYKSMIRSLMYLTSSRPDIMFVCKKQTVVATSTTEAEYVAAASCYGQVL